LWARFKIFKWVCFVCGVCGDFECVVYTGRGWFGFDFILAKVWQCSSFDDILCVEGGAAGCEMAVGVGGWFFLMSGADPIEMAVSPNFLARSCVFDVLPVGSSGSRASKWIRE
jgi:hypothetical protein